jgi:NAD-dependent deacetylase
LKRPMLWVVTDLAPWLDRARRILAFTGAGISTGSGIPDFRGPSGVWKTKTPVYYQAFMTSEAAQLEYWQFKHDGWSAFRDALPNAAHRALAELEALGKLECVVTQNIDGLHQAAGNSGERLVELHGTQREVECTGCGVREPADPRMQEFGRTGAVPRCTECNAVLKPAVVMFGQALDSRRVERAFRAAEVADLVIALGSTLVVTPAADVPLRAARRGIPYIIVNRGETAHDALATVRIDSDVGDVLSRALQGMGRGSA